MSRQAAMGPPIPSGPRGSRCTARVVLPAGGLAETIDLVPLLASPGPPLLIDCRDNSVAPVAIPHGVAVVVVHCGVPRTLVGSEYASRRAECGVT